MIQITGFTDDLSITANPRGVKIRYKLVQNATAIQSPASSPFREYDVTEPFVELAKKYPADSPEIAAAKLAMGVIGSDPTAALNRYAMDIPTLPEGALKVTMTDTDRQWSRLNKPVRVMVYREELAAVILTQQTNNLLRTTIWGRRHGQWKVCLKADLPEARTLADAENNFREQAPELYDNFQQLPDQPPSLVDEATRELTTNLTQMTAAMVNSVTQMMSQVPGMSIGTPIIQSSMTVTVVTNTPNAMLPDLAAEDGFYVIARDDTVARIARRFGLSVADLMAMNPGLDATRIKIGQKVRVYIQATTQNRSSVAGAAAAARLRQDLKARISATASMTAFPDRDEVLAAIAKDAARAGDVEDAREALTKITAFPTRDDAICASARLLVAAGKRSDALELAKLVTAFPTRDALIAELAK
jgi:LysM repeat protein